MRKIFTLALAAVICAVAATAQIVTTAPAILQEASKNVVLTYNAASPLGNNGLKGLPADAEVYAHVGVITTKSKDNSDWKYGPANWGDNSAKYKLVRAAAGSDLWKLDIGDIRTYFGMTDPTEKVRKIALVFRTADTKKEGKTAAGGDIFVDVFEEGFQMLFTTDAASTVLNAAATLKFNVVTSQTADITIAVDGTGIASATGQTSLSGSHYFGKNGNYTVTATAKSGSQTIKKSMTVAFPAPSVQGNYPGGVPKMGAVQNADGTVTFCLAAPGKSSVVLVPSWDDYQVLDKNSMKYQDYQGNRYFWITVSGLNTTGWYPYYYMVDGTYKVADPYARLVLDCYSDKWLDDDIWPSRPKYPYDKMDDTMLAVYRANMDNDFKFSDFTIPNHKNLVIYEMLLRDFTGTDKEANGEGTIRKARAKLQYLANLGINAIELMPVMEFNGNNSWGYNTNFYFALDKAYGSPAELKNFVEECHRLGIAVILDIVFNQSDGLHPWYQMYPVASNPFYNQTAPHAYSVLNDWKQENPLVRQQWKDCLQMWMKAYNVDGFRFDLVKGLGTSYGSDTNAYNASRVAVMKDLHAAMKAIKPDAIHINENLAGAQEENEMFADGQLNWANVSYNAGQFASGNASGSNLARFLSSSDSRTAFSTVSYAESHDEERMGYKQISYGTAPVKNSDVVKMARLGQVAVQMLLTPGPKMIWQFGELGADQTTKKGNDNDTDPKTVVWHYMQDANRAALLQTYKAMCRLRTQNPDLFDGTATFTVTGFGDNLTTMRTMRLTKGSKEVVAYINPLTQGNGRAIQATTTVLNANNYQVIASSNNFTITPAVQGTGTAVSAVGVPSNGYLVVATKNAAGVDDIVTDSNPGTFSVYALPGQIVIEGEYQNAAVYNMQGRLQTGLSVDRGLYIVKVDGTTVKVLVP